jgi:hypothetical protein
MSLLPLFFWADDPFVDQPGEPGLGLQARVEVALSTAPFAASPSWTDISGQVWALDLTRDRRDGPGGPIDPATLRVTVENNDGRWNNASTYATAPYAGNVVPGRLVRIRVSDDTFATSSTIFTGFLDDVDDSVTQFAGASTLRCSDIMRVVERSVLNNVVRPAELTGQRVAAILTAIGIPNGGGFADFRGTVDAGTVMLEPAELSGSALAVIRDITRAELGMFYVSGIGQVEFRDRYHFIDTAALDISQATFDGDEIEFGAVSYTHGAFTTPRRVAASGATGRVRQYGSLNLPANFPNDEVRALGLPILYDGDAEVWAEAWQKMHETDPVNESRISEITLWVASVANGGVATVRAEITAVDVDLFTAVSVLWRPAGWSADHDYNARVSGISHSVDVRQRTWYTRLKLNPRFTRYQGEHSNHFYEFGDTITSDHRGSI